MPSLFCKMGLIEQIKHDIEDITSDTSEFGVPMVLKAPNGATATINGFHSKHHLSFTAEGKRINTRNAHVSFSEKFLTEQSYPLRNSAGKVDLAKHEVTVKDSTGTDVTYVIENNHPDETIGLIVCILGSKNG